MAGWMSMADFTVTDGATLKLISGFIWMERVGLPGSTSGRQTIEKSDVMTNDRHIYDKRQVYIGEPDGKESH